MCCEVALVVEARDCGLLRADMDAFVFVLCRDAMVSVVYELPSNALEVLRLGQHKRNKPVTPLPQQSRGIGRDSFRLTSKASNSINPRGSGAAQRRRRTVGQQTVGAATRSRRVKRTCGLVSVYRWEGRVTP